MNADALFGLALEQVDHQSLGPYRLLETLGEGGLGVVWRAEQLEPVRRHVALKLIRPGLQIRRDVIARFEQERRTLARMQHPNVAAIYDAGSSPDGRPYFVMELVEGSTLTDYCWTKGLDLRARLQLFATICDAVQHAHQKGILHRDLKPSNIMISVMPGGYLHVKLLDFGLAKYATGPSMQTADEIGNISGSVHTMAPEQLMKEPIDQRTDLYALGCVFYFAATGVMPFEGPTLSDIIQNHLQHQVEPFANLRPDLNAHWTNWVMQLIAFHPEDRPQSAALARTALDGFAKG